MELFEWWHITSFNHSGKHSRRTIQTHGRAMPRPHKMSIYYEDDDDNDYYLMKDCQLKWSNRHVISEVMRIVLYSLYRRRFDDGRVVRVMFWYLFYCMFYISKCHVKIKYTLKSNKKLLINLDMTHWLYWQLRKWTHRRKIVYKHVPINRTGHVSWYLVRRTRYFSIFLRIK